MDDFDKLINASDLIEWIMETYPDWCIGDIRSIVDHINNMPTQTNAFNALEALDCISRQAAIDVVEQQYRAHDNDLLELIAYNLAQLPSAKPEQRWIPCSERLPEEKGKYLTTYHPCYWDDVKKDELKIDVDTFQGKTIWAKRKHHKVIAWMELPEPWKEED